MLITTKCNKDIDTRDEMIKCMAEALVDEPESIFETINETVEYFRNLVERKKGKELMRVFVVQRTDKVSWCEDYKAVVVAEDTLHAEKFARCNLDDFSKAELKITEVELSEKQIVTIENTRV